MLAHNSYITWVKGLIERMNMCYRCINCDKRADEYDYYGYPEPRECEQGGRCDFMTEEEITENEKLNDEEAYQEDRRLGI